VCIVVCKGIQKYSFAGVSLISTLGLFGLRTTDDLMCKNVAEGADKKVLTCELPADEVTFADAPVVIIRQPKHGL